MALNSNKAQAPANNRPKTPDLDAGNYMGRVVQVLDLGLQPQRPYKGEEKPPANEIMLTYELGTEFLKDEDGVELEDKPRWLSETFPLRHAKSELAKSTKRMKAFDPNNALQGDFAQLPNMACTITVGQWVSKQDPEKTGNSVLNITPAMKGFPVPELQNPPKVFDMDEPDMKIFGSLPEWLQGKMKDNLNYNGSALQAAVGEGAETPDPKPSVKAADTTEVVTNAAVTETTDETDSPY